VPLNLIPRHPAARDGGWWGGRTPKRVMAMRAWASFRGGTARSFWRICSPFLGTNWPISSMGPKNQLLAAASASSFA